MASSGPWSWAPWGTSGTSPPTGDANRAQLAIGIHKHKAGNRARVVNPGTVDVADIAAVRGLAKTTVHTRQMADDDIVIDGGDTIPGLGTDKHVVIGRSDTVAGSPAC
jgi:hypothetical protein